VNESGRFHDIGFDAGESSEFSRIRGFVVFQVLNQPAAQLRHLEAVCEAVVENSLLVHGGHLSHAGQPSEGGRVQDPIAISLERCPERVSLELGVPSRRSWFRLPHFFPLVGWS
jgi:hypothetical protein